MGTPAAVHHFSPFFMVWVCVITELPAWVLRGLSGIAALVMIVLGIYSAIGNLTSFDVTPHPHSWRFFG